MESIGQKIIEIRKRKGLSQESLSDLAKVNLRTIQRIEKGETQPLGHTLRKICDILEINIEEILDYGKVEDNKFNLYLYISVLSFIVIPLGNILVPMILWINKRDKIIDLNNKGIQLLKFQILWSLVYYGSIVLFGFMTISRYENRFVPLMIAGFFILINLVYVSVMSYRTTKNGF